MEVFTGQRAYPTGIAGEELLRLVVRGEVRPAHGLEAETGRRVLEA